MSEPASPAENLCRFIDTSPSPYHAVATAAAALEAAGFTAVDEAGRWPADGRHYVVRDGSIVAWTSPPAPAGEAGFRIVGAHTDSPNLRVKPRPDTGRAGWAQLRFEVYGSPLLTTWFDRDLGLSGRAVVTDGVARHTRLVRVDRPLVRLASLAIHLDRGLNERGVVVNPQEQLAAVWAEYGPEPDGFRQFLAKELEVDADALLAWDVMVHDVEPARIIGRNGEFVSAARLDNLCSCWAAVQAITRVEPGTVDHAAVICLFDHEEVGSGSAAGADGPLLATVLERVVLAAGGDREAYHQALARSLCASSDMAHATHPNHADRHEPGHWVTANGGPVIKTNAGLRYATDAPSAAAFLDACLAAGVPCQHYVHRGDMPCGSTIGPITAARLGIPVVDVGAPQLAMHSARELMGSQDPDMLARALTAFMTV